MFCQRSLFKLSTFLVLLNLAITPALFSPVNKTVSARDVPQEKESDHPAIEIERKPQRVFAPHWTTQEDFSTTIYIRNVHISQPTIARTSLILDHRTIMLPDTFVDSLQTVALDVKKALVESGENPEQSGGAVIDFEAESAGAVNAYAEVLDTTRSLSFSFPFMQDGAPASGPLDAVAWFYSNQTDAFVALQNTREKETTASLTIFVSGRPISLGRRLLKPREVTTVQISSVEIQGSNNNSPRSAGVRVDYASEPGAVVAQGWVVDRSIGFSAPFAFHPKSNCDCGGDTQHKYGTGIMLGRGGMTAPNAPSADIIFSPYLAVRNRSDKPLTISPLFSYQADDKVERVKLPAINLISQESTVVNLREFQEKEIMPLSVEMGNIDLRYTGEAGALLAELASVDHNGSFVSPVPLICNGGQASAMSYWRTDGDWHSSVTIENIASEENDLEITVSYPGGIYLLEKRIAAGETTMVSINELQQSQAPDREGRRIPTDATLGGINIWAPDVVNGLVINAMLMNPVTKTCGQCIYPGYVMARTVSDKQTDSTSPLYSGFDPRQANQSFNIWLNVRYSMGGNAGVTPSSSSSSNPSVATASGGFGFALNVGTTSITAVGNNFFTDSACSQPGNISSTATLTVIKVDIKQDGTVITNTTRNVIVGQKISLTVEVQPTTATTTNKKWTIPEVRVANYVVAFTNPTSPTSATVTALAANPSGSAVDFYWVDGGDGRQVQISLKVNGVSFTAVATFNVKRPTAEITSTTGTVSINTAWGSLQMTLGTPSDEGIVFTANVTMPQGFSGSTEWVQAVTVSRTRTLTNGTVQTASGTGLDTFYPYPVNRDSPGVDLTSSYTNKTVNDSYKTYLLFMPSMANSIWVPLGVLNWSWSGTATRTGSTWALSNASNSQNPVGVDTTTHPTWSLNAASLVYH